MNATVLYICYSVTDQHMQHAIVLCVTEGILLDTWHVQVRIQLLDVQV